MTHGPANDRFEAAFLGFAIGDALGMPAQFLTADQIRKYYGGRIRHFVAAHPGHASDFLPAGAFTDETQLMLATAGCLVECGDLLVGVAQNLRRVSGNRALFVSSRTR